MRGDGTNPTDERRPARVAFQFGLKHLLALPILLATFYAVGALAGWTIAVILLFLAIPLIAWVIRGNMPWPLAELPALVLVILFLVFAHLSEEMSYSPEIPKPAGCSLRQIALALRNYHETYDCFPPAYVADENGRPMHSWRVLILPQLDYAALYEYYHFDEPWDGPNNRQVSDVHLDVFRCPADADSPPTMTSYLAVIGPGTAWPGSESNRLADFTDDPANTILVVEVANSGVRWAEPRDLHVLQMAPGVNPEQGQGISSLHGRGACVVCADGSIRFLDENISAEELRALLGINDDQVAADEPPPASLQQ